MTDKVYFSSSDYVRELIRLEEDMDMLSEWDYFGGNTKEEFQAKLLEYDTMLVSDMAYEADKDGKLTEFAITRAKAICRELDTCADDNYTENDGVRNLVNCIRKEAKTVLSLEEIKMAYRRIAFHLQDGSLTYIGGKSMDEILNKAIEKVLSSHEPEQAPIFRDYAHKWYEIDHVPKVKDPSKDLIYLTNDINPFIGNMRLNQIRHDDIQPIFNRIREQSKSKSSKVYNILHQIMQKAYRDRLIDRNPVADKREFNLSQKEEKRQAKPDEVAYLMNHLDMLTYEQDRTYVMLMRYMCCRKGEAMGLMWDKINFETNTIQIDTQIPTNKDKPELSAPKWNSKGVVGMPPQLREQLLKTPVEDRHGFVLKRINQREDRIECWTKSIERRAWSRIIRETGAPKDLKPHEMRHTGLTQLADNGMHIKDIKALARHKSAVTTMRYQHETAPVDQANRIMSLWDE